MRVWTISAEEGTPGREIATRLAEAAGVPLLDRDALVELATTLEPGIGSLNQVEERIGGRFNLTALGLATSAGAAYAVQEFQLRQALPALARAVVAEAVRQPCVILAPGAFAALDESSPAVRARVRAPLAWRIDNYRRTCVVDKHQAAKAVKHDDHLRRVIVKTLYHLDLDDPHNFGLVLDASRLSCDRAVDVLLAAAGAGPA